MSGNVNQTEDVILTEKTLIKVIVYSVCFEQEEAWYLLLDDNTPEAMSGSSSGQGVRTPRSGFILPLTCYKIIGEKYLLNSQGFSSLFGTRGLYKMTIKVFFNFLSTLLICISFFQLISL